MINFFVHIAKNENLNLKIKIQKISDKKSFKQSQDSSAFRCLVIYCTYMSFDLGQTIHAISKTNYWK